VNALRKLSTGKRTALAYAALVAATAVTELITGAGPGVRAVTVLILAVIPGVCFTLRLIGPGKGERGVPRRYIRDDLRPLPVAGRVIPRAATAGAPPWPDVPPPDGFFIAAGTVSDGRLTSVRVAVLPPPVEAILGHRTVDEALDSMFNRAMARQVRELTDGAL
jgi:hypothetical protein